MFRTIRRHNPHSRGIYWPQVLILGAVTFILIYALWAFETLRQHAGPSAATASGSSTATTIRIIKEPDAPPPPKSSSGQALEDSLKAGGAAAGNGPGQGSLAEAVQHGDALHGGDKANEQGVVSEAKPAGDSDAGSTLRDSTDHVQQPLVQSGTGDQSGSNAGVVAEGMSVEASQPSPPPPAPTPTPSPTPAAASKTSEAGQKQAAAGSTINDADVAADETDARDADAQAEGDEASSSSESNDAGGDSSSSADAQGSDDTDGASEGAAKVEGAVSGGEIVEREEAGEDEVDNAGVDVTQNSKSSTSKASSGAASSTSSSGVAKAKAELVNPGSKDADDQGDDSNGAAGEARELQPRPGGRLGRSSGAQNMHTKGGTLYSWGLKEWRLGRNTGDNSIPLPAMPKLVVTSVAASRHSAIATLEGHVFTMGHNDSRGGGGHGSPPMDASGQLGRSGSTAPGRVMGELADKYVVQVVAGRYHTMAVTADGELYTWGLNDWGQLGRAAVGKDGEDDPTPCTGGPSCHTGLPGRVTELSKVRIVAAAAGRYTSLATDEQGRLYTWGYDGCSNSGKVPPQDEAYKPRLVKELAGEHVVSFDAGYVFWLAATEVGDVWTCNSQDDGYAGTLRSKRTPNDAHELGREGEPLLPGKVGGELVGKKVVTVAAGREHAVVVTADGKVYTWGGRDLLAGRKGNLRVPGLAKGALENDHIVFVAAGEYFSAAASRTAAYGWGSNDYLCLGVGRGNPVQELKPGRDRGNVFEPVKMEGAFNGESGVSIQALVAGFQHALAIASGGTGGDAASAGAGDSKAGRAEPRGLVAGGSSSSDSKQQVVKSGSSGKDKAGAQDKAAAKDKAPAKDKPSAESALEEDGGEVDEQQQQQEEQDEQQQEQQQKQIASKAKQQQKTKKQDSPKEQAAAGAGKDNAGAGKDKAEAAASVASGAAHNASDYHTSYLWPQIHPPLMPVAEYWHRFKRSDRLAKIKAMAPDVFASLPPSYDKRYKNPCWKNQNGTLRCLPYYHILGVSKCGTTDLYHRLSKHPQMYESANKGPHWWDECPYPPKSACTAPPNGDFEGYINLFSRAAEAIATKDPQGITGEASSNTFTSAAGVYLRGPTWDSNTTVTMPELLREAVPFTRLIAIFRNPVDRYYSAFYYYRWWVKDAKPPGPDDFHKQVVDDIQAWRSCVADRGHKHCVRHYHPQQLVKGMYSEFLPDWLSHWPRDQLLLLRNEDYAVAQRAHMEAVFKFLDMKEPSDAQWNKIMAMKTRNKNSDKYAPMHAKTRALLSAFYRPFNEKLAALTGDKRYLWLDDPKAKPSTSSSSSVAATDSNDPDVASASEASAASEMAAEKTKAEKTKAEKTKAEEAKAEEAKAEEAKAEDPNDLSALGVDGPADEGGGNNSGDDGNNDAAAAS